LGIKETDKWLEKDFWEPEKVCSRLLEEFGEQDPEPIYGYLARFGMYRPDRVNYRVYEEMSGQGAWEEAGRLLKKYRKKWNGPDTPVYIFPVNRSGSRSRRSHNVLKSGVSFPDKMFLFFEHAKDEKELEALFVHEYHHVCRIRAQKKKLKDYTLLDSMVLEGMAEYAVEKNCGKDYLAPWCTGYSEKELGAWWEKYLKEQLGITKNEEVHDQLLFGKGRYPDLLGYAAGYWIVNQYFKKNNFSTKASFNLKPETLEEQIKLI
jgi:uncharacterized protein YjaZ